MESPMVHIGNNVTKEDSKFFAENVVTLFEAAEKFHITQETLQVAIKSLLKVTEIKGITITNSTFASK